MLTHSGAQITMKTVINRRVLDVGQVCAKMDRKDPNTEEDDPLMDAADILSFAFQEPIRWQETVPKSAPKTL